MSKAKAKVAGRPMWREVLDWAISIVLAFIIAWIIRSFVFTMVLVEGQSMENTLHDGDRLFVSRLFYTPKQGDIIVFTPVRDPERKYVKRIIAVAGQTVDIDYANNMVYVDGKALREDYIKEDKITLEEGTTFPTTVPEDSYFVMGDNRNASLDSRSPMVGFVKRDAIMGKAVLRTWPLNTFGGLY